MSPFTKLGRRSATAHDDQPGCECGIRIAGPIFSSSATSASAVKKYCGTLSIAAVWEARNCSKVGSPSTAGPGHWVCRIAADHSLERSIAAHSRWALRELLASESGPRLEWYGDRPRAG